MRVLLTIEYYGKNYAGWQRQKNALAVQQVLEEKLSLVLQAKIVLTASGRTDRGVHALRQKAHFDYEGFFPVQKIAYSVNTTLPGLVNRNTSPSHVASPSTAYHTGNPELAVAPSSTVFVGAC